MKNSLTIIFTLCTLLSYSQNTRLVSSANRWNDWLSNGFTGNERTRKFTFSPDTTEMGGAYYQKLLYANEEQSDNWTESGEWWREEAGVVYKYQDSMSVPIYDFTLEVNDTFTISDYSNEPHQVIVYAIDTVTFLDEIPRKRILLHCPNDSDGSLYGSRVWIEGIGDLQGLNAYDSYCLLDQPYAGLLCFYRNSDLVYTNEDIGACWITATEEASIPLASIAPNPASNRTTLDFHTPLSADTEVAVFSPLGRLVYKKSLVKGSQKYELGVEMLPAGVYTVVLRRGGVVLERVRLVVVR